QALLAKQCWQTPNLDAYPTGQDIVEQYLFPLAHVPGIKDALHLQTRVTAVSRVRMDKAKTPTREETPFVVRIEQADAQEQDILARAVIDASGTYQTPNPLGAHGLMALGEQAVRDHIFYGIPDVLDTERARYAGKRVLVVGSGHSAQQTLLELAQLAEQEPDTQLVWAIRRPAVQQMFGGGADDALPERGQLGLRSLALLEQGQARLVAGVEILALKRTEEGVVIVGEEERIGPVDEIIATTGFRPDLSFLREVRLSLDPGLESPQALAPLIDPNIHSCGTVPPHGVDELSHPETNLFIVGMKSYGRAPTFLMLTGYEQVRSIVAALTGDWESARRVELVLPETGVCSTDLGGSCCTPAPALVQVLPTVSRRARPVGSRD
ncbi:MAG TPA: SidA/IucD/PvdA family monooxygenase, partial [Ktedonobacteraceae bacterium]|nr:SidA/IucD/PvdA family monooxygenase [Ktedonobacteraceae bacterium]